MLRDKQWHGLNFQRVIWDLPVEAVMSHTANCDKGARKEVSRSKKSDVMPCQLKKGQKNVVRLMLHPSGTVSHQQWGSWETKWRYFKTALHPRWIKGHQVPASPRASLTTDLRTWRDEKRGIFEKERKKHTIMIAWKSRGSSKAISRIESA